MQKDDQLSHSGREAALWERGESARNFVARNAENGVVAPRSFELNSDKKITGR
jgi:hypothetical protein